MAFELGATDAAEKLSPAALENVKHWLTQPKYGEYRDELVEMIEAEQWQDLENAFFKVIEFGTAGRRGTTGIGSNRINRVTIGESAQALCEYALQADASASEKGIVIACDTRLSSPELSTYVAGVCAANGFRTYIYESFRSTPQLSFTVRHLGAAAGIVISASHNPPADNGFKAFWSDGGQLVAPHDKGVLKAAEASTEIKYTDYQTAVNEGKIIVLGREVDDVYIATVAREAEGEARGVKIIYSPLHGAGQTNTLPVLKAAGFTDIAVVEEQMVPDGHFPTIENNRANPEDKPANDLAVAKMLAEDADIAITNDPDADRVGVMVRQGEEVVYLSGNQAAVLAADYVLKKLQEKGMLTSKHYLVKTIVTTDMLQALADHYQVNCYGNLLVGFKYVGEIITKKEGTDEVFVTGSEESFGLLKGNYARDKDGAAGALPLAEYAAELKAEGKTLYDKLCDLYAQHGIYLEQLVNAVAPGADGFERMARVMKTLRENTPTHIGSHKVTAVSDYQTLERIDTVTGEKTPIDCVTGNVVVLELDGDTRCRVTVRPSGTEPKMKFYVQWYAVAEQDLEGQLDRLNHQLEGLSRELEGLALE